MRIVGSEVLRYLTRSDSIAQEGGEVGRRAANKTLGHAPSAPEDQVALSMRGRAVQRLSQLVRETPEIREGRVVEAQHALTAKTLPLDGRTLAPKLLAEALIAAAIGPA